MKLRITLLLLFLATAGCNLFGETEAPIDIADVGVDTAEPTDEADVTVLPDVPDTAPDVAPAEDADVSEPDRSCAGESDLELCGDAGVSCGEHRFTDRCGEARVVVCGGCEGETTCVSGVCECLPETDAAYCQRLGKNCGTVSDTDNCGAARIADCGSCSGSNVCGGGSVPNVCDCPAQSDTQFCNSYSATCGELTELDACGAERSASCGTCTAPNACGGGGALNECGCAVESETLFCSRIGAECGSVTATDNCNNSRMEFCGSCDPGRMCEDNVCVCQPETDVAFCARVQGCGVLSGFDNCGNARQVPCNHPCPSGETCVNAQCTCQPESQAAFCANYSATCGTLNAYDQCGNLRTEVCGTCSGTGVCFKEKCHVFPTDGLVLNMKASQGVTIVAGRVHEWLNLVDGTFWTAPELADRPVRVMRHQNHQAIAFQGSQLLQAEQELRLRDFTISLVIQRRPTPKDGSFLGSSEGSSDHTEFTFGTDPRLIRVAADAGFNETVSARETDILQVITFTYDGSVVVLYQNHQRILEIASNPTGRDVVITQVGAIARKFFLTGDIYEIYAWEKAMDEHSIDIVAAELIDRYDL